MQKVHVSIIHCTRTPNGAMLKPDMIRLARKELLLLAKAPQILHANIMMLEVMKTGPRPHTFAIGLIMKRERPKVRTSNAVN
jgi:hypothetical protein